MILFKNIYLTRSVASRLCILTVFMLGVSVSISSALTTIFAIFSILFFFISGDYHTKFLLLRRFYIWPTITLILFTLTSCFYSHLGFSELIGWVMKFYKLFIVWVVAYLCNKDNHLINKFLTAFFIGVFINILAIFINYYLLTPEYSISFSSANFPAAQSHFVTGFIFAIAAFMSLSIATAVVNKKQKIFFYFLSAIIIYAELGLNTSRTGFLIEFSILISSCFIRFRLKKLLLSVISILAIFTMFYYCSPNFKSRVYEAHSNVLHYYDGINTETSIGTRLGMYRTAFSIFKNEPKRLLYGCGTGNQLECSRQFIDSEIIPFKDKKYYHVINNPHNQYIYFLIQSGILSLVIFIFLLFSSFYYSKDLSDMMRHNARILIIAFSVGCLFNSWILDIGPGFIFCFLLPVLLAELYSYEKNKK